MKRKIFVIVFALLLLSGCVWDNFGNDATGPGGYEGIGLYDPNHPVAQQAQGAVKVYTLKRNGYTNMALFGDAIILMRDSSTELYGGEMLDPLVTMREIPSNFQILDKGIGWLDPKTKEVIFLNDKLVVAKNVQLSADQTGEIWITDDGKTIYYCTAVSVRALDLESGRSRLIYEGESADRTIVKGLYDGEVLLCKFDGQQVLIASGNGEVLSRTGNLDTLESGDTQFYITMETQWGQRLAFGTRESGVSVLWAGGKSQCVPVPEYHGAVGLKKTDSGMELSYFDLESGKKTALVKLDNISSVEDIVAATEGNALWLRCMESESGRELLCLWELEKSQIEDDHDYTDRHFTPEQPDKEEQRRLTQIAQRLEYQYAVNILLWREAGEVLPSGYEFQTAYLTEDTENALNILEKTLKQFPPDFFAKVAARTGSGKVHIALLDEITAKSLAVHSGERGLMFWSEGELYIALAADEGFEENLLHQIGHMIDSRVMSVCQAFDDWSKLNPEGFRYDHDFAANLDREDFHYLEGDDPAFLDVLSMSYGVEDRATIFAYAMAEGNEDRFRTPTMQTKLKVLCRGIREAFDLGMHPGGYHWEQYLEKMN